MDGRQLIIPNKIGRTFLSLQFANTT